MILRQAILTAIAAAALSATPSAAHHSFAAEFDATRTVDVTGVVTSIEWRNPHTYFYMDVQDEAGEVQNWAMEMGSPNGLRRNGWRPESLNPGDVVSVEGFRARDGSYKGNARSVVLSTGERLFAASSAETARDAETQNAIAALEAEDRDEPAAETPPDVAEAREIDPNDPTPRLSDGRVNLGGDGMWRLPWITDFGNQLVNHEEIPWLPWTKAMYDYNQANNVAYDPQGFCLPPGGPRMFGTPYPAEFIQDDRGERIIVIFEGGAHVWREIHMDGREHPEDFVPSYFGHSIGWWEGDTLVIDTIGFNERTWLNFNGAMHTDALHTIERITRPSVDTLHYEATIDDPEAYAEPWTIAWDIPWAAGEELAEYICQENNQYIVDLKDDFGEPFFPPTDGAR